MKYTNALCCKVQRYCYGSFKNFIKQKLLGFVEQKTAKLCAAGYVVSTMGQVHVSNSTTIKSIYYAYFHCIIIFGIIFWCNSSKGGKIFTRKAFYLWLGHQSESQVEVCLHT